MQLGGADGGAPIAVGVGITGSAFVGNIQTSDRLVYGGGDVVNLASRIQGLTRELGAPSPSTRRPRRRRRRRTRLRVPRPGRDPRRSERVDVYALPLTGKRRAAALGHRRPCRWPRGAGRTTRALPLTRRPYGRHRHGGRCSPTRPCGGGTTHRALPMCASSAQGDSIDMTVVVETITSDVLRDNPLRDPHERRVPIYLPPDYDKSDMRYPVVYFLAGFSGGGVYLLGESVWGETLPQRIDRLVRSGEVRPLIVVMADCLTRYGGSQYINSAATGRYADHVVDELVPFVDTRLRTLADREQRVVMGKSSGGYGATILAMRRPECSAWQ
jgi:hypothetical protein